MVSMSYMTDQPPPPAPWKRVLDQEVIPLGINFAGRLEVALTRASERARRKPATALLAAMACGYLVRSAQRRLQSGAPAAASSIRAWTVRSGANPSRWA